MPISAQEFTVPSELPNFDLGEPTTESLEAEAAAMGTVEVAFHPADLVADAEEMLEAQNDLEDLVARGYPVSEGVYTRIRLLAEKVAPKAAELDRMKAMSEAQTVEAEKARKRLLTIRASFSRIGRAVGLPGSLFSLETRKTTRLNVVLMKMEEVLANVQAVKDQLPDRQRIDQLMVEARRLIDKQKDARRESRLMRAEHKSMVIERERYERLLYEAMMYLSAQGMAAYDGDEKREPHYRLDHCYGKRPSKVGDPGCGGVDGVADACSPAGEDG